MAHMLTVGQNLWCVPTGGNFYAHEVTVTKVARNWAYITSDYHDTTRMDMKTFRIDGGKFASPGVCYVSKEVYDTLPSNIIDGKKYLIL